MKEREREREKEKTKKKKKSGFFFTVNTTLKVMSVGKRSNV